MRCDMVRECHGHIYTTKCKIDSGGSPPIESRVSMVRVVIMGVLFQAWDSDNVVVVEF